MNIGQKRSFYCTKEKNMKMTILNKPRSAFDFIKGLILSTSLLIGVFLNVSAQNKAFTEQELEALKRNAAEKSKTVKYRSVTSKKYGKTEEQIIYEFVPPDRKHFIIKKQSPPDRIALPNNVLTGAPGAVFKIAAVNSYDEWIYVGEKIFYRNGVEKIWKPILPSSETREFGYGNGTGTYSEQPTKTTEYKLTPNQTVNRQDADLYEVIVKYKYSYSVNPLVYSYKYWINKNGLFAKTHFDLGSGGETIVDYEYNSNIKIRVPFIKKTKKK